MTDTLPILQNWKAKNSGSPELSIHEYPLYTDAEMIPQQLPRIAADCPYHFLRMTTKKNKPGYVRASLILRIHIYDAPKIQGPKTDTSLYHGGLLEDEIAALASLCYGVRLRAGGKTRQFEFGDGQDPLGTPFAGDQKPIPTLDLNEEQLILPHVAKNMDVLDEEALERLEWILALSPKQTTALIRAARLYQNALWIAESEPELAWLMMVSSLETAAKQYWARIIPPKNQPTKKFIDFVLEYLPSEPVKRPKKWLQVSWSKPSMKKALSKIYDYRSNALHEGIPFPKPMCNPPFKETLGKETRYAEKGTPGVAASAPGGSWKTKDVPINLHTFHYIVRHVLLNWWKATEKNVRNKNVDRDFDAMTK